MGENVVIVEKRNKIKKKIVYLKTKKQHSGPKENFKKS